MSHFKKLCILWLFIAMVAFSSCSNDENIVDVSKHDEIGEIDVPIVGGSDEADVPEDDGSKDLDELRIWNLMFEYGNFWIDEKGRAWFDYARKHNLKECYVGDEVRLCCQVTYVDKIGSYDPSCKLGDPDLRNLKITAKITSSKTGDVQYLTLLEPVNIGYAAVVGSPASYFGRLHISISDVVDETNTKYATLKVSPDGDIVIAEIEIEGSSRKATVSLIVKGIENE